MKNLYYLISIFFYFIGDLCCRLLYILDSLCDFFYRFYQKSMNLSLKFDEKCGYKIWKE